MRMNEAYIFWKGPESLDLGTRDRIVYGFAAVISYKTVPIK